ncbi:LysE/ArgO family amino acid transporter [Halioxenophilus aromaticivorans]|uniref:LysE/ArgO family amino acid transporter n=1 Tax=Halioxenophilus aromaticivorans TaxID=1306992 RepID=A0AAV3U1I6_9ALTE
MSWLPVVQGYTLTLGLIMAIGAQNALLLAQSIRNQHQWLMAGICIALDIILVACGVFGLGLLIENNPEFVVWFKWGGAGFLLWYGWQSFRQINEDQSLKMSKQVVTTRRSIILATLAVSLLNPHVYLDTVVLIGSVGAQMPTDQRGWFVVGTAAASCTWFISLCVAGRLLQPLFNRAIAWKILHSVVGVTMWAIALSLVLL